MTNFSKCVSAVTHPTTISVPLNSFTRRFKGSNLCVNPMGRSGDDILISINGPDIKLALKVMILSTASCSRDSICGVCDDKFGGDDNDLTRALRS